MRPLPLLLLVALAVPLAAQPRSNTEGLFLQIGVEGQGLALDPEGAQDDIEAGGGGVAIRGGYGFSPLFTLYGGLSGARVEFEDSGEEADLGAAEIGGRFNVGRRSAVRPYLDVALRGVVLQDDRDDLELRGGALSIGGGLAYFLSPTVALDVGLHLGGGRFDELSFDRATLDLRDDEIDFGEGRLTVGLTAYPFARADRGRRGGRDGRNGGRRGRRGVRH